MKAAATACALLCSCTHTVKWQGADGSSASVPLVANYNIVTQEDYSGRGGLVGMFGLGRTQDGQLARRRTYTASQAEGAPFSLHVGPDGITMTAATVDNSTHTGRVMNGVNDGISNVIGGAVAGKLVGAGKDIGLAIVDAAAD